MSMIAYNITSLNNQATITNSFDETIVSDDLEFSLIYLLQPYPSHKHFRVVWDLDQFVAQLLCNLPHDQIKTLVTTNKLKVGKYHIIYNPRRSLYLSWGGFKATYYGLSQYYPNQPEPPTPFDIGVFGNMILVELESIGVQPTRLSSPVSMFDGIFAKFDLPTYRDLPDDKLGQLAWECANGAWVEAHQLGHFNKAYDYDIIAGYPSVIAGLLDTRYGVWVCQKEEPREAVYGFCKGKVTIKSDVSPILYRGNDGHTYSPTGTFDVSITKQTVDFIKETGIGSFVSSYCWWWLPVKKVYPLQLLMHKLFSQRSMTPLLGRLVKGAMVGIYGRFLQVYENSFSVSFNPVWGSIIETNIALQVARFISENNLTDHLIHISTDGVLTTKEVPVDNNGKMGSWRLDSTGEALCVSSGCLFYGDKKPAGILYPEAMNMIKGRPNDNMWEKVFQGKPTLLHMAFSPAGSGDIRSMVAGFRLKQEHDRHFPSLPASGKDLINNQYDSEPLDVGVLQ